MHGQQNLKSYAESTGGICEWEITKNADENFHGKSASETRKQNRFSGWDSNPQTFWIENRGNIRSVSRKKVQNTWNGNYKATMLHCSSVRSLRKYFVTCIPLYLFININQLDALNFIISLFQAPTCFEHMCSSSGGQNCIIRSLVCNTICPPDDEHTCSKHVGAWNKLIIKFSASSWLILINKYIEMHGEQNIKKCIPLSKTEN